MSAAPVPVAVIGVGQVGSRFDEEPGRPSAWSHVGAYLERPDAFTLVGVCDPNADSVAAFQARCPGVPTFDAADALLANVAPQVISICTPTEVHRDTLSAAFEAPDLRLVWCEKPMAPSYGDASAMVDACHERGVTLVVSHVRRWVGLWRRFAELIGDGAIGELHSLRVAMPNRLWSIGSHAVDLIFMLGGPVTTIQVSDIAALGEDGEPARVAFLGLEAGGYAILQVTGHKSELIVEAEATGSKGRLYAREDRGELHLEQFRPSAHFVDYLQLGDSRVEVIDNPATASPFVAVASEIAELLNGKRETPSCSGTDARAVIGVLEAMEQVDPGRRVMAEGETVPEAQTCPT